MDLARAWLQAGEFLLGDIAGHSGRTRSAAFAQAFRQVTGGLPHRTPAIGHAGDVDGIV